MPKFHIANNNGIKIISSSYTSSLALSPHKTQYASHPALPTD